MVMFLLSFVKGSKSAKGGKNPLADMDPGGPILGGSKSARTPALEVRAAIVSYINLFFFSCKVSISGKRVHEEM